MKALKWYCDISSHEHSTEWESKACSELYKLWQTTLVDLNNRVRSDEVEHAVNMALLESDIETEDD
jgi:hypothetical protein